MTITEEDFKEKFLETFRCKKYTDEDILNEPLNREIYYDCEGFQFFLYRFLKDNNLPLEICGNFPWSKYFQGSLTYAIEQLFRRLFRMKYDKDFFEPEQPFYYETLKNHLFSSLEKLENEKQTQ